MSLAIVVVGHVDHGKTTLIRALTGSDTDRLAEEKRRGLSIVPGFAHRDYGGEVVDFIDVPGHADFIHAMVRGASGAGAMLLVISAREGIAAQTHEHLRIAELLGLRAGVVALTHCDAADEGTVDLRLEEVGRLLDDTVFAGVPVIRCAATEGLGLEALHGAIAELAQDMLPVCGPGVAFLPIDRAFTVQGRGVVVTGTLQGAAIATGDRLRVEPLGREVVARTVQSRGVARESAAPGARVAVNLRGIDAGDVAAGDVLCADMGLAASGQWDVEIALLQGAAGLRHMQQMRVLIGTTAVVARVRLLERAVLHSGQSRLARLEFDRPRIAFAGQRAVLRHLSPALTCGGAIVLDPFPPEGRLRDRMSVLAAARDGNAVGVAAALAGQGPTPLAEVARLARQEPDQLWPQLEERFLRMEGNCILSREAFAKGRADFLAALGDAHAERPLRAVVARQVLPLGGAMLRVVEAALLREGAILSEEAGIALVTHDPLAQMDEADQAAFDRIEGSLREGGAHPPDPGPLTGRDGDIVALLVRSGHLIRLENVGLGQWVLFHREAVDAAAQALRLAFPPPTEFRTGEARAALSTSRKFVVPLLEHFDRIGTTLREGDRRRMRT